MNITNTKWPELETLLKNYMEWYRLENNSYERDQWEINHGYPPHSSLSNQTGEHIGKIFVIKKVRQVVGFGLREAKELVDIFENKVCTLSCPSLRALKGDKVSYTEPEKQLLEMAGFSFERKVDKLLVQKSRMLRVDGKTVKVVEKKYCVCVHSSKTVEWRVVGEYKIDIAKYCPECGKYLLVG